MIAIDTNILVHAHRGESPFHDAARLALEGLAGMEWAIPWPCVHEFLATVTHPRIFETPTPLEEARLAIDTWCSSSRLRLLSETTGYWEVLANTLTKSKVVGPRIHDARIACLCLQHAVSELWTADRDFGRFPELRTHNPLVCSDGVRPTVFSFSKS